MQRVREQFRLEDASGDHLVQTSSSKQGQPQFRASSRLILNISKDGHWTMSLGRFFQEKNIFLALLLNRISFIWTCAHYVLSCSLKSLKWDIFFTSYYQVFIYMDPPESSALSICLYERCFNDTIAFRICKGLRFLKENLSSKDWRKQVTDKLALLYVTLLVFLCHLVQYHIFPGLHFATSIPFRKVPEQAFICSPKAKGCDPVFCI